MNIIAFIAVWYVLYKAWNGILDGLQKWVNKA
jgi:hypothetical protein